MAASRRWVEAGGTEPRDRATLRIDTYPYRHRIRDVMSGPRSLLASSLRCPMRSTRWRAKRARRVRCSDAAAPATPASTGIVTERDVLRALRNTARLRSDAGRALHEQPAAAVPAERSSTARSAMSGRSAISGCRRGRPVVGARRDLSCAPERPLGDEIDEARDAPSLGRAWASCRVRGCWRRCARDIAAVISASWRVTRRPRSAEQRCERPRAPPSMRCGARLAGRGEPAAWIRTMRWSSLKGPGGARIAGSGRSRPCDI